MLTPFVICEGGMEDAKYAVTALVIALLDHW